MVVAVDVFFQEWARTTPCAFFFFNAAATTEIYTLSLHDALPISGVEGREARGRVHEGGAEPRRRLDRKSTRLNSSHPSISYAVFCLKKKKLPDASSSTALLKSTQHEPELRLVPGCQASSRVSLCS